MFGWKRWWVRTATVYAVSAAAFMIAVLVEVTMVSAGLASAWLDIPIFFELRSLVVAASTYPLVMVPFLLVAEVVKQVQKAPLPWPAYVMFTALFTASAWFLYDFGGPIYEALAFIENDVVRVVVILIGLGVIMAGVTALLFRVAKALVSSEIRQLRRS